MKPGASTEIVVHFRKTWCKTGWRGALTVETANTSNLPNSVFQRVGFALYYLFLLSTKNSALCAVDTKYKQKEESIVEY